MNVSNLRYSSQYDVPENNQITFFDFYKSGILF
jgi:hypothetical protein